MRVNTEVISIDRANQQIKVRETDSGKEHEEPYDSLILSTGASPLKPPIPGIDRPGHFAVRNIPDVQRIKDWIKDCSPREINCTDVATNTESLISRGKACRAVVVGGGYIGLEMAEQLVRHGGLSVTVVEALPQVMTPLDPEMAAWLHQGLRAKGVELYLNDPVSAFEAPKENEHARASVVTLKSGRRLEADTVVLGLGVRPEIGLAKSARSGHR